MSNKSFNLASVAAVLVATQTKAAPKVAPESATFEDLAARLKVYGDSKVEGKFFIAIDGPTCRLPIISDGAGNWASTGILPDFDGTSEEDKDAVRQLYSNLLLTNSDVQAQARAALVERAHRLAENKRNKAAKEMAAKAFKAELAQGATTPVAAVALAEAAE